MIFVLFLSFFSLYSANNLKAAEKINIKFEEMSIPLTMDQLSNLETFKNDSTEVIDWLKENGFSRIFELSKFLKFPVFKEESLNRQVLRSWVGRKILTELSNTILVPNDKYGIKIFNTIESLLESKQEVSTLDILKALPSEEITLDIDNLITIISSWKKELAKQQNLIIKLNSLEKTNNFFQKKKETKYDQSLIKIKKKIYTNHRVDPLNIEIWKPSNEIVEKDLIIFMPGLGGDINNFRWIGFELSRLGWPVLFIDHKGSNSEAISDVLQGSDAVPSSVDLFSYRMKDLDAVIKDHNNGVFGLANNSYILMGHSLGALIAFLYEGDLPKDGFLKRCDFALKDLALTNLSKLFQCQLNEIPLPQIDNLRKANAIIGFNSFGSIIWPKEKDSGIEIPILLIGGTFDLITPLISEQFKLFLSTTNNPLNRFLIIEGASHFSPIRINYKDTEFIESNDIFKINQSFIGSNPNSVQNLSLKVIVEFLENIKKNESIKVMKNLSESNLDFHILDRKTIKEIIKN
nr:alpha/beta hydrolase [Prochlorococcus marinus]